VKNNHKAGLIFIVVVVGILIYFVDAFPNDRVTNLISCGGALNINENEITTAVYRDGTTEYFTDYCSGKNVLQESYCYSNNEMRTKRFFCAGGCVDEICFSSEYERLTILGLLAIKVTPKSAEGIKRVGDFGGDQGSISPSETGAQPGRQAAQIGSVAPSETSVESGAIIPAEIRIKLRNDPSTLSSGELEKVKEAIFPSNKLVTRDEVFGGIVRPYLKQLITSTPVSEAKLDIKRTDTGILIKVGDGTTITLAGNNQYTLVIEP